MSLVCAGSFPGDGREMGVPSDLLASEHLWVFQGDPGLGFPPSSGVILWAAHPVGLRPEL